MDVSKLKIGYKLWSTKHKEYGEILGILKDGWIKLRISGKIKVVQIEELRRRKPLAKKKKKSAPKITLFEDLSMKDQKRVLKASNHCDLPIQTVMEELGLT